MKTKLKKRTRSAPRRLRLATISSVWAGLLLLACVAGSGCNQRFIPADWDNYSSGGARNEGTTLPGRNTTLSPRSGRAGTTVPRGRQTTLPAGDRRSPTTLPSRFPTNQTTLPNR